VGLLALALGLTACMGIDVASIRRADPQGQAAAGEVAVASGRIRFIVDGRPLEYGFLNKPTLQLYHRGRGQLMSTPEVAGDGRFRWQLPAGDYGIAVVHGGMPPPQVPHVLPGGALVFLNGVVDPGVEFTLRPGRVQYLGTLVVEVESRPQRDVLFGSERVFGRLLGIRVDDEGADERRADASSPPGPALMRRVTTRSSKPS
jgi:hypothetical protein